MPRNHRVSISIASLVAVAVGIGLHVDPAGARHEPGHPTRVTWVRTISDVDPYSIAARIFAERLDALFGAAGTLETFPGGQLGDERDILAGIKAGSIDAALISTRTLAQLVPEFAIFGTPFLFADAARARQAINADVVSRLGDKLAEKGVVLGAIMEDGFRQIASSGAEIRDGGDFKGRKVRVVPGSEFAGVLTALGARPVDMPYAELFPALQRGAVDATETDLGSYTAGKLLEVAPRITRSDHAYLTFALIFSKSAHDKLPAEAQQKFLSAAKDTAQQEISQIESLNDQRWKKLPERGITVSSLTDRDKIRKSALEQLDGVLNNYRTSDIGRQIVDSALQ